VTRNLSLEEFTSQYLLPRQPVIITDAARAQNWKALGWTPASLKPTLGVKHLVQRLLPYERRREFLSFIRRQDKGKKAPDPRDERLREQCAPDVERLSALLERDLSHWQRRRRQ
jgi:hypothetical protein